MKQDPELNCIKPQYRICREDGTLVSRADFATPELKYAIYVDGAAWHLTPDSWQRDRRLRSELRSLGWQVTILAGYQVEQKINACLDEIHRAIEELKQERA